MKLPIKKADFSIYVYDEDIKKSRFLKDVALGQGYSAHFYSSESLFLQAVKLSMPHVVWIPFSSNMKKITDAIRAMSCEISIVCFCEFSQESECYQLVSDGHIADVVVNPFQRTYAAKHTLKVTFEYWVLKVTNESLEEPNLSGESNVISFGSAVKGVQIIDSPAVHLDYQSDFKKLKNCSNSKELIRVYLDLLGDSTASQYLYLKYDVCKSELRVFESNFQMDQSFYNLGLKLNELSLQTHHDLLSDRMLQSKVRRFVKIAFDKEITGCFNLENHSTQFGYLLSLTPLSNFETERIEGLTHMCSSLMDNIFKTETIFNHVPIELRTHCIREKKFYDHLSIEVSRARRLKNSVSLVVLEFSGASDAFNLEISQLISKVLKRFTRTTDLVGRVGAQRFAVLLNHTHALHGVNKSKKVLSILRAAMKDKGIGGFHIGIGVADYPNHADDAMSLLERAEAACDQSHITEPIITYSLNDKNPLNL